MSFIILSFLVRLFFFFNSLDMVSFSYLNICVIADLKSKSNNWASLGKVSIDCCGHAHGPYFLIYLHVSYFVKNWTFLNNIMWQFWKSDFLSPGWTFVAVLLLLVYFVTFLDKFF